MNRGFTLIELLVYAGLFSILFIGIVSTWLTVARSGANFERLAQAQEASIFVAQRIAGEINIQPDYSSAQTALTSQAWHTVSLPIIATDSTSSITVLGALTVTSSVDHANISFSPLAASSTWSFDFYRAN